MDHRLMHGLLSPFPPTAWQCIPRVQGPCYFMQISLGVVQSVSQSFLHMLQRSEAFLELLVVAI